MRRTREGDSDEILLFGKQRSVALASAKVSTIISSFGVLGQPSRSVVSAPIRYLAKFRLPGSLDWHSDPQIDFCYYTSRYICVLLEIEGRTMLLMKFKWKASVKLWSP